MTDSRRSVRFWQKPEKSLFDVFAIFAKTGQKMTKTSGFHVRMRFSGDPVWEGGSSSYSRGHLFWGVQNRVQNRDPLFDPFLFQNRVNFWNQLNVREYQIWLKTWTPFLGVLSAQKRPLFGTPWKSQKKWLFKIPDSRSSKNHQFSEKNQFLTKNRFFSWIPFLVRMSASRFLPKMAQNRPKTGQKRGSKNPLFPLFGNSI